MFQRGFRPSGNEWLIFAAGLVVILVVIGLVRLLYKGGDEPLDPAMLYPQEPPKVSLPEGVTPLRYALDFTIIPEEPEFSGTSTIEIALDVPTRFVWLNGRDLKVSQTLIRKANGKILDGSYEQVTEEGMARVNFPKLLKPGTYTIQLEFRAPYSDTLSGLYKVKHGDKTFAFSQFQSVDARRVFPGFDEPRFKTPFDISVTAPKGEAVVSNGTEMTLMPVGSDQELHLFDTTEKLTTAILGIAVGPFEVVDGGLLPPSAHRSWEVPLKGYTMPGKGTDIKPMLEATRPMVEALEIYFDQPYPFAKLGLVAVPNMDWAGMENAAAIFYRENYILVNAQTSADAYLNVVDTHAHELAHQWFGNLVTPQWWDDVWLNESFASWIAGKIVNQWDDTLDADDSMKRWAHQIMGLEGNPQVGVVRQDVTDFDGIITSFSDLAYYKGGGVLEMVEAYVGEENFREGVAMYMKRHRDGHATIDDFIDAVSVGSGHPEVEATFKDFLTVPGIPVVEASLDCSGTLKTVTLLQTRFSPIGTPAEDEFHWTIPVCYRTDLGRSCHMLSEKSETLRIGKTCPSYLVPNADGSGYYMWALDADTQQTLMKSLSKLSGLESESMAFNLDFWYRSGRISTEELFDIASALVRLGRPRTDAALIDTFKEILPMTGAQRTAFEGRINTLFAARARELGLNPAKGETAGRSVLRDKLVPFLALTTRDASEQKRLLDSLRARGIQLDKGFTYRTALVNHRRSDALFGLSVLAGDRAMIEDLVEAVASGDTGGYGETFALALGRTQDAALGRRLLQTVLLAPSIGSEDALALATGLSNNPVQAEAFWKWMGEDDNGERFLERQAESYQYWVVELGSALCDQTSKETYVASMKEIAPGVPGGEGSYNRAIEAIDQCLAFRAAREPDMKAFFK